MGRRLYLGAAAHRGLIVDLSYALVPFVAWLVTGCTKFAVNCIREKRMAFDLIGYGGLPSNHSAIVSSVAALIALKEGVAEPAFGVAVALAFIVMLDANSLRKQVGLQAQAINRLQEETQSRPLRERIGHSRIEILTGIIVGCATAYGLHSVF